MEFRTEFNYNRDKVSEETGLSCPDPSRASQSEKDECDINNIVARFGVAGRMPDLTKQPLVGDFSDITDFASAVDQVRKASAAFMQIPAEVRRQFDHDPAQFEAFVQDEANRDLLAKTGLLAVKDGPTERMLRVSEVADAVAAAIAKTAPKAV